MNRLITPNVQAYADQQTAIRQAMLNDRENDNIERRYRAAYEELKIEETSFLFRDEPEAYAAILRKHGVI